jgi:hypothetical protein
LTNARCGFWLLDVHWMADIYSIKTDRDLFSFNSTTDLKFGLQLSAQQPERIWFLCNSYVVKVED